MTAADLILLISAIVCGATAATFCVLYAQTRRDKKRLWWQTETGRNIMGLGASIAVLCAGTALRLTVTFEHIGAGILTVGYFLVGGVMAWRTVMMWRANHPREPRPKTGA